MADSIREQIIAAVVTKLADIRTAKAYNTECGQLVKRAEPIPVDTTSLPASSVFPLPESGAERFGSKLLRLMEMRVQAISNLGGVNASVVSEKILADLIECIFGLSWTMEIDSGGTYEPEVGDAVVGEDDGATAIIEAITLNSGTWAGGDADATFTLRRVSGTFADDETLEIDGNANSATVDGALTGQTAVETTTGDLADSIDYVSGGTDEYPANQEDVVGAGLVLNIGYKTQTGDPYTQ